MQIDPYIGSLLETDANQAQQSFEFPGNPPSGFVRVTAVPEPSSLILMVIGLAGFGLVRRRK